MMSVPGPLSTTSITELIPAFASHMVASLCFLNNDSASSAFTVSEFGVEVVYLVVCAFS